MTSSLADALSTLSDRGLRRLLGARTFLRGLDYEKRRVVEQVTVDNDSATGKVIILLLEKLQQEYSSTLLMVTHNTQAANYCHRIVTLRDGQIVQDERFERAPANVK